MKWGVMGTVGGGKACQLAASLSCAAVFRMMGETKKRFEDLVECFVRFLLLVL